MSVPSGEFRTMSTTLAEPSNRVSAGTVINSTCPLDFGTVNNTGGNVLTGPKVIWWRCKDMSGFTVIDNMKFWLSSNSVLHGTNEYYCDIANFWTQNKTISQTASGSPGIMPQSIPSTNISKIGGGEITGTYHADTTQYIYIALSIGQDETIGNKGGTSGGFQISLKFDYV